MDTKLYTIQEGETARYDCEVIPESSNIYTFVYVFSSRTET